MIEAAITNSKQINSPKNITKPPPASPRREANSLMIAPGKRDMIPTRMINEIPLPIPLSVMRSPSHITNILPPQRISVEVITKMVPLGIAEPACANCTLKFIRYEGPCINRIATVR